MNVIELLSIVANQGIRDVHLIMASLDGAQFAQAEDGPLCIRFESAGVMFQQVRGNEEIEIRECELDAWLAKMNQLSDEYQYVAMNVFDLFCYRRNAFDVPPTIDRVVAFRKAAEEAPLFGLLLTISTGGKIGMEASADGGLRYFLDGQTACFEKECVDSAQITKRELWTRGLN